MRDGRPHVLLKLAVSADGKAGLPGRKPVAITGEPARARVHLMRAETDAILIGIGTVLSDDPHLTCRLPGMTDGRRFASSSTQAAAAAGDVARRHRARDPDLGVRRAGRVGGRRGHPEGEGAEVLRVDGERRPARSSCKC